MASSLSSLGLLSLRNSSKLTCCRHPRKLIRPCQFHRRKFHSSPVLRRRKHDDDDDVEEAEGDDYQGQGSNNMRQPFVFSIDELDPEARADYESRSFEDQQRFRDEAKRVHDHFTSPAMQSQLQGKVASLVKQAIMDQPHVEFERKKVKPGFFNMGEDEPEATGEDEEFEGDDLSELGHAELDRHREMRHYARIAAWEMPMLSKLARPFEPPNEEEILRFRYTTYLGEEHPAAKKIVLEFCTKDLPNLTEPQRIKLIKLVGSRYNPETDIVKMSCESFETQAQNKRYLGDLVDTLCAEARDATDMFEDVPLDFRYHKFKRPPRFPEEWKLTEERMKQLEGEKRARLSDQDKKQATGLLVDGSSIVQEALAAIPAAGENVLVEQSKSRAGKGFIRRPLAR